MSNDNDNEFLPDRKKTLEDLCGLQITIRKEKGQNVFDFFYEKTPVITVFSYKKAKCFALGVKLGRKLGVNQ